MKLEGVDPKQPASLQRIRPSEFNAAYALTSSMLPNGMELKASMKHWALQARGICCFSNTVAQPSGLLQ